MRARMALGLIALTMLLSSCSNTGDQADILTPGLLPDGYTMEQAEGDERILLVRNALAVEDGDILSGQASWDCFLERARAGESAFVRLLFCREEDGALQPSPYGVFDLFYDGSGYTVYYNDGEFTTEGTDLYGRRYEYLLALEESVRPGDTHFTLSVGREAQSGGRYTHFILTDDEDLTAERYLDWSGPLYSPNFHADGSGTQHMRLISFYVPDDDAQSAS